MQVSEEKSFRVLLVEDVDYEAELVIDQLRRAGLRFDWRRVETEEELPYATTVIVDSFEEGARLTRIAATIYCERDGQKAILLGKGGKMLKAIGTSARMGIEKMVGTKVFLELFVKVQAGWRDSRRFVEELDWRRQMEQIGGAREG